MVEGHVIIVVIGIRRSKPLPPLPENRTAAGKMQQIKVRIQRLSNCKSLPEYASPGSAGLDLSAGIDAPVSVAVGAVAVIPSGVAMEIPFGYEGQIRARSGLAVKFGVGLVNGIGTIDSDYRGEVMIPLINWGRQPFVVQPGERLAQLVIMAVPQVVIEEVSNGLSESDRGRGGFGSTGKDPLGS